MRIVDSDTVELSNLNRQILHWTQDTGENKVDSARAKLGGLNPQVKVEALRERITEDNVAGLTTGCDLIIDAMDNLQARYLLNRTAFQLNIPFIHGAVHGFEGRAMTVIPGRTACLMCMYRGATINRKIPVLGATAGVIACIQATEAIKYITGLGQLLTDRLLIYDGLNMRFAEIKVRRDPDCPHCGP
jgi:molybdopterin/thiamine biosynthesis adenylyltransferase